MLIPNATFYPMRFRFFLCLSLLPLLLYAQLPGSEYQDMIVRRDGPPLYGVIIEYRYAEKAIIVLDSGAVEEVTSENIKRISYFRDRDRSRRIAAAVTTASSSASTPPELAPLAPSTRRWRHQASAGVHFGSNTVSRDFDPFFPDFPVTVIGGSMSYHLVRTFERLRIGGGLEASLMNNARREYTAAATFFAEFPLLAKTRKFRPLLRMEAGPALPFGTLPGDEITRRRIGVLYHPSVGVDIRPGKGHHQLLLDAGYRFLKSELEIVTNSFDLIDRSVNYRRLFLRASLRL